MAAGAAFMQKMWGTSSPNVKLTSDFDNAIGSIRIGDCFPFRVFTKIRDPATFDFCNTIGGEADNCSAAA
jgi:hypothetical protein